MGCFSWYLRRFEGVDGRMYAILVAGLPAAGKTRFAEREILAGRDLLIENNFEDESYEPTKKLLEKYGCDAITVRFQGDIEAIYSRFLDRERSPDRHPGHIRNDHYPADDPPTLTSPTLEQFAEGAARRGFARFSLGRLIEVDATDVGKLDYEAIERRIDELLGTRTVGN